MNNATLVETLRPLPRPKRVQLATQVDRLRKACEGGSSLETFQADVLNVLRRMFGATAGSFWFRPWGGAGICPSVRSGFQELTLSTRAVEQLDHPVSSGWQATQPQVHCVPDSAAMVLVAPLRDGQSAIGALQLVLLPSREVATSQLAEASGTEYARALAGVVSIIQPALLRRMQINAMPLDQAQEGLQQVEQQIAGVQRTIRTAIERYLQQLSGATFGSLQDNQTFVRSVQQLLDAHGLRVRCPECGHPAILRCSRNASVHTGVFVFDHYLPEGRTFHGGGRTLPTLRTISKPSRRKSSS